MSRKYREGSNANRIWERIIHELYKACSELNVEVKEIKADRDHIHILIRYLPTLSIEKIVHHLKQVSTYRVWKAYERYLKTVYWHERTLWSDGYFAANVGNASRTTIEKYIQNQG